MKKATLRKEERNPTQGKFTAFRCFISQHAELLKILETAVLLLVVLSVVGAL